MATEVDHLRQASSAERSPNEIERSGDNNWRERMTSEQCLSYHCLSEHLSDVSFTFNADKSTKLPAHKFVLSMRSAVFETMFYGSLSEGGQTVLIEDVEPDVMKVVLQYIYSDKPKINGTNVFPCLFTAKKYDLSGLVRQCSNFIEANIDESIVCSVYEQALFYEMKPLQDKCLSFIFENATDVLSSPDFFNLSHATLLDILKKDELACEEIEIFHAAIKWAESNKESAVSVRDQLGEAVFQMRFPIMPIGEFALVVSRSGILTNEELVLLYTYHEIKEPTPLEKFRDQERSGAPVTIDLSRYASAQFYDHSSGCFLHLCYESSFVSCCSSLQSSSQTLQQRKKYIKIKSVAGSFVKRLQRIHVNGRKPTDYIVKGNKIILIDPVDVAGETTIEFLLNYGNVLNNGNAEVSNPGYSKHITRKTKKQANIKGQTIIIERIPEGLESITFV